jgi:epoxyqueuosine reductase
MEEAGDVKPASVAWIGGVIRAYAASVENRLDPAGDSEPAWAEPLVGFSRGDDPLYGRLKEDIGPFFWTPAEAFATAFPGSEVSPAELTVISWVLPQTELTRRDNAREEELPAKRWALSRKYGEEFNARLRDHVVSTLIQAGCEAMAPQNSPHWMRENSPRYGFASSWSERHAAFVSGLGTFGLCDGLITPKGKAVRLGSVVARIAVPPSDRPYETPHAYCLYYRDGSCGICVKRCPAGAISKEGGHDKVKCKDYSRNVCEKSIQERFGIAMYACGLCQVGVPCEAGIPVPGTNR